jgi:hypothetical protein
MKSLSRFLDVSHAAVDSQQFDHPKSEGQVSDADPKVGRGKFSKLTSNKRRKKEKRSFGFESYPYTFCINTVVASKLKHIS